MPRATTSNIYFVYVLESDVDNNKYIGFTINLRQRLEKHQRGLSFSTKSRLLMRLIYFEACINEEDAKRREKYLKSTKGHRFLAKRLKTYFKSKL